MPFDSLDARTQTRTVTAEYLDELYEKASALRYLLEALDGLPKSWNEKTGDIDPLPCVCDRMADAPHTVPCRMVRVAYRRGRTA